ncbi:MAG: hypothetical protein J5998_02620 [Clostridia bacterium]|nr:hypothetical protein [Clostridia bacterium]
MSKKKKKRRKLFYPIYFTLVLIAVAAIWIGCSMMTPYLADYEKSNPEYAINAAMRYFENGDAETFYYFAQQSHPDLFRYESKQDYIDWATEKTQDGTFTYNMAYSDDPSVLKYNVKLNGEKFGSFTLKEQPDTTEYHFSTWAFDSLEIINPAAAEYTVTVPSGATVRAGEEQLTAQNVVESGLDTPWTGHMLLPETQAPTQARYTFTRFFGCPEITVTDEYGNACAVTGDAETGFTALRNNDDGLQAATEGRVTEFVKAFSSFTANDLSRSKMLKYVRKGTTAYPIIETFDNSWFKKHSSAKVENLKTENYIRFTDDTMACDVSFDHVVQYNDGEKIYPTAYRCYFVLRNDEWYLYDFESIQ